MKPTVFLGLGLWLLCSCIGMACKQEMPAGSSFTSAAASVEMPALEQEIASLGTTVYVCHSTGAKKYHLKQNCGGLKRCKHDIVTMTSGEAQKIGLGLCGYED